MRMSILTVSLMAAGVLLSSCATIDGGQPAATSKPVAAGDIGHQTLPANDGWAAEGGGTYGGSKATAEHVYIVTNRAELVKALAGGGNANVDKIIYVKGRISLNVDDSNRELTEKDYAAPGYSFEEYVKAYAPATWNTKLVKGKPERKLTGPQEEAREASQKAQAKRVVVHVTSNTSIIGMGNDAKIVHGNLFIGNGVENVIIRNITFEDSFDLFPQWDPGDSFKVDKSYPGCQEEHVDAKTGPQMCPGGRWNSEYDLISINGGQRVWIDHCTFNDGDRPDKMFPPNFPFPQNQVEQKIQHHDGLVDITNAADFVTLSYNHFQDHDKTSLIGGSDSSKIDAGKLNATYHDNWFDNSGQRLPRVRFGKVHSYNNYFTGDSIGAPDPKKSEYENHLNTLKVHGPNNIFRGAFGIGKESAIYSEYNYMDVKNSNPEYFASVQGGKVFFDQGSMFNGKPIDAVAVINAADPKKQVSPDVGWKPTLYAHKPIPAAEVPAYVKAHAGAGKL